jgi:hypothetical protein
VVAPGQLPKYESKDRFSCMITMTCLNLWMPRSAPRTETAGKACRAGTLMIAATAAITASEPAGAGAR